MCPNDNIEPVKTGSCSLPHMLVPSPQLDYLRLGLSVSCDHSYLVEGELGADVGGDAGGGRAGPTG